MTTITQKPKPPLSLVSHQSPTSQPLSVTQLPGFIINRISSFTSNDQSTPKLRTACRQWEKQVVADNGILNIENSSIADQELIQIIKKNKKPITHINLHRCPNITDAAIKHLATLQDLTVLNLTVCNKVTNAGIAHLASLRNLKTLSLILCAKITDASAQHLAKLQNLTALNLRGCSITDEGVKEISKLPHLKSLILRSCPITDAAASDIAKLQTLTELDLSLCIITNASIAHIFSLKGLTALDLKQSQVTNICFETLVKLPNLKKLNHKNIDAFEPIKRTVAEKDAILQFIIDKSTKFGISSGELRFCLDMGGMDVVPQGRGFQISSSSLYLLVEKDIESFLAQNPNHRKSIQKFLVEKRPELLEKPAEDLIEWHNNNKLFTEPLSKTNELTAKEILTMHALGYLPGVKRFILTHEMGHAHDWYGAKSLGAYNPRDLDFIQPHQSSEVRADLTAARENSAHKTGIAYFEWCSIFHNQPSPTNKHPTDINRAKAIKIDYDKIQQTKAVRNLRHRSHTAFAWKPKHVSRAKK